MTAYELGGIVWRKSSYSGGSGGCVEMGWRKSSHSGGSGDCVEVANVPVGIAVRDSKHPTGPTLAFEGTDWDTFLRTVRA